MSWLYSLLLAGIVFSGNGSQASEQVRFATIENPELTSAVFDEIEKFEQTYPLNPNGRVSLSNVNGSIIIEAWDRNEVRLEATKIADSKETLAEVEIVVDASPDYLKVETDYKGWRYHDKPDRKQNRKVEVQYRLSVPRTAILNEIETVNGSVNVSNFTNVTKISAVNGNVTAANLRGTANLSTVNGEVNADFDRTEPGTRISLSTVNGRVNLVLPSDVNATIKADSLNGPISNEYGLPVKKGEYIGRNLHGRVGSGEVQIKLNSVNGGLSIGRQKDGKQVNPSQNLLQDKDTDDDFDDDSEGHRTVVNTARVNREVARAVRESQRATAAAIKESTKAMVKIKPEIEKIDLKELEDLKIEIDNEELQAKIKESIEKEAEARTKLRDAVWSAQGAPTIEKRSNTFPVKGVPMVTVDAKGCNVRVRGWDKPEVRYVLTEIASNRSAANVPVKETVTESSVTLTVANEREGAAGFWGHPTNMRLEVFVPKRSNLKITTDGEIRLEGVSGEIDLKGDEESINIRDSGGKLRLVSAEGQVRVVGFKGEIDSEICGGNVFLEGDFDKLSVKATDGSVTLIANKGFNAELTGEAEVTAEGVQLVRESSTSLRVGSGGPKYSFDLSDGKLIVRNSTSLETY